MILRGAFRYHMFEVKSGEIGFFCFLGSRLRAAAAVKIRIPGRKPSGLTDLPTFGWAAAFMYHPIARLHYFQPFSDFEHGCVFQEELVHCRCQCRSTHPASTTMSSEELEALLAAPALDPPPGVTANFDNPPNRNGLAWGVTTVCTVILTLCLLIRLYARTWMEKKLRVEEGISLYFCLEE